MVPVLCTGTKPRWSIEETRTLEDLWPKAPRTRIEEAIPNRTWHSIRDKASKLGIKRETLGRNPDGTFKQVRMRFSLENFDDGHIDNHERFRVWLPEHSRAYNEGYILRSIIAYEAYHDVKVPPDMDIHHKDEDRLNDSKENLEMMPHSKHSILSNLTGRKYETRVCENCGKEFDILAHRLRDFSGGSKRRGIFCSPKCYHEKGYSLNHRENISKGLKKAYREGRR